jgi:hypothetical protein
MSLNARSANNVHRVRRERGEGCKRSCRKRMRRGRGGRGRLGRGAGRYGRGAASKIYLFHMRACHSGAAFAMAFPYCSQQAFLEAHVLVFDWFGGVFGLLGYDNLASAVKQVLRGRRRVESDRFIARCAPTISTSRSSRSPGSRAPTKRAVLRARSGVSAAVISSRSPTLGELNAHECSLAARPISHDGSRGAPGDRRRIPRSGAPAVACTASRAGLHSGGGHAAGGLKGTGHDQAEPLLGPRPFGRVARPFARWCSRDRAAPRRRDGRSPRASTGPLRRPRIT